MFNTNELRLPLSVMVGITNTSKTFPYPIVISLASQQSPLILWLVNLLSISFITALKQQSYVLTLQKDLERQ
jgi:hypothetical protein